MSPGCAPNAASVMTSGKFWDCCTGGAADAEIPATTEAITSGTLIVYPAVTPPARVLARQYG